MLGALVMPEGVRSRGVNKPTRKREYIMENLQKAGLKVTTSRADAHVNFDHNINSHCFEMVTASKAGHTLDVLPSKKKRTI